MLEVMIKIAGNELVKLRNEIDIECSIPNIMF